MTNLKKKERELKEYTEYYEYLIHNISKGVMKRVSMQRKLNFVADEMQKLQKEINIMKGIEYYE